MNTANHIDLEALAKEADKILEKAYFTIDDDEDKRYYDAEYKAGYKAGYEAAKEMMYTLAKWELIDDQRYECSRCNRIIKSTGLTLKERQEQGFHLFCNHCGAKMHLLD